MRSERPISSSRSAEISSTARPVAARVADVVPDRRLGADVDAAGRVRGDQQHRVAAHLAADDELLLVAAGQRARGGVDATGCGRRTPRRSARLSLRAPARSIQAPLHRRARGSGGRGCGSPTAGSRAAGRAGAGPRGCSRCRPRGAAGSTQAVMSASAELDRGRRSACRMPITSRPARPGRCPRRRRCRAPRRGGSRSEMSLEQRAAGRVGERDVVELEHLRRR